VKVLSKSQEIINLAGQLQTKSIKKKDYEFRRTAILNAPYQFYENGVDVDTEINMLNGLRNQKVITKKELKAQLSALASLNYSHESTSAIPAVAATIAPSKKSTSRMPSRKKPFYKKPGFIILGIFVVLIIIAAANGGIGKSANTQQPSQPTESSVIASTPEEQPDKSASIPSTTIGSSAIPTTPDDSTQAEGSSTTTESNQSDETNTTLAENDKGLSSTDTTPTVTGQGEDSSSVDTSPTVTKQEPSQSSDTGGVEYIGNRNTKVFHLPTCGHLPAEKNRVYFNSRQAAIDAGYRPCKICNP